MPLNPYLEFFPDSTTISANKHLEIAGFSLIDLAEKFHTPVYVYDAMTFSNQISSLKSLLAKYYPGTAAISYASKAYFSASFAKILKRFDLGIDLTSLSELSLAKEAGISPDLIHLNGNNKSLPELCEAVEWGIHSIVIDNLEEIDLLEEICARAGKTVKVWLRITPDLPVETHPHVETSNINSKFGLHIKNNHAQEGIQRVLQSKYLILTGLHTHLGSQITSTRPYELALECLFEIAEKNSYTPLEICPGGGWGERYNPDDPYYDYAHWVRSVSDKVIRETEKRNWPLPKLILEPGRSLIAKSGVALYKIGSQKDIPNGEHILSIDGGISDNPRYSLYRAKYVAVNVTRINDKVAVPGKIVGRFCETGDILIDQVYLPKSYRDDILAIPVSGAYQLSMASNYNLATRPTVLWLEKDHLQIMQNREFAHIASWWTQP